MEDYDERKEKAIKEIAGILNCLDIGNLKLFHAILCVCELPERPLEQRRSLHPPVEPIQASHES